ncbi:MAG: hypothetical protein DRM99_03715, partial [Thermoplasmata archaeon]
IEVRELKYKGNLKELAGKYSPDFNLLENELGIKKYYLIEQEGESRIEISLLQEKKFYKENQNPVLFVSADSQERAKQKVEEVVEKFGVETEDITQRVLYDLVVKGFVANRRWN